VVLSPENWSPASSLPPGVALVVALVSTMVDGPPIPLSEDVSELSARQGWRGSWAP
jgi:hypothetical protein